MAELPQSTVEAMAQALHDRECPGKHELSMYPNHATEYYDKAELMLQAALEEGCVVLKSDCDNSVAVKRQAFEVAEGGRKFWMERAEEYEQQLRDLREAAQAVYDVTERQTNIFERLRRELER